VLAAFQPGSSALMISLIPVQARIRRYGAPITSSAAGVHHNLFISGDGLKPQATAPSHPPMMEIVAAGFLRRIQEQTMSLLKTITATASIISRPDATQCPVIPITGRTSGYKFLALKQLAISQDRAPT
jgi:hypothetical protein